MMGDVQESCRPSHCVRAMRPGRCLRSRVLFSQMDWRSFPWAKTTEAGAGNMDAWDGSAAGREKAHPRSLFREAQVPNTVVLTGDAHGTALEIKEDWKQPGSRCLGVEFLVILISSGGDGGATFVNDAALHADNPHLKFASNERGYNRHVVTPKRWQADFRVVERVSAADAPVITRKSFVVEAGRPGLLDG